GVAPEVFPPPAVPGDPPPAAPPVAAAIAASLGAPGRAGRMVPSVFHAESRAIPPGPPTAPEDTTRYAVGNSSPARLASITAGLYSVLITARACSSASCRAAAISAMVDSVTGP